MVNDQWLMVNDEWSMVIGDKLRKSKNCQVEGKGDKLSGGLKR